MPRRKTVRKSYGSRDETDNFDDFNSQIQPQRNAANARERARMRVLSKAFCRLKTTLPWVPADTKLSKLDTLRLATSYIAHLRTVLKNGTGDTSDKNSIGIAFQETEEMLSVHPKNLTWPFAIQQQSLQSSQHQQQTKINQSEKIATTTTEYCTNDNDYYTDYVDCHQQQYQQTIQPQFQPQDQYFY